MLKNITLGQFFQGDSFLHNLDSRTKLFALVPLIAGITLNEVEVLLIVQAVFAIILVFNSGVPAGLFVRRLRPFILLFGLTFLLHALLTEGEPLFYVTKSVVVSREGFYFGLFFALKLFLMILYSLVLMFTTSPTDLTDGIEKIVRPLNKIGVPADQFALMLGISFRFIPVLFEEADRIKSAQIARGAQFTGSMKARLRSLTSIVIPLFISVFNRANTLGMALEARGFGDHNRRTYFKEMNLALSDYAALMFVALFTTGIVLFNAAG